jgi:glycosyltransferase involved in cell wall biosynthesis
MRKSKKNSKSMKLGKIRYWLTSWIKNGLRPIQSLKSRFTRQSWSKPSIAYYTGKTYERWSPESLSQGLGGAQTAVIYLAREWVKLGYTVVVFAHCTQEGIYESVRYVDYRKFNSFDQFDLLILWREKTLHLLNQPISAAKIWLDLHDFPDNISIFSARALEQLDLILVKSNFQRRALQQIPEQSFHIVPNGIATEVLNYPEQPRNPYRLIYASRYYRGLEQMLMFGWPIIKQDIPEAELFIYGGWSEPDNSPHRVDWKRKMMVLMQQPGIVHQGRIGQNKLLQEKSRAAIHYYACTFAEIDCISARESVAVGCVPVTSDFAVFSEKSYCVRVSGDPLTQIGQEAIANKVVELLKHPERLERLRSQLKEKIYSETWDNIARRWINRY